MKISRHYFFVFSSFSSYLLHLYYAQDSSKKWQEIFNKIGLTFPDERAVNFSSLFSFSSFSFSSLLFFEETGKRQSKISRHFFVFVFFVFLLFLLTYLIFTTRRIVPKSDKKYKASSVWLSQMINVARCLVTISFFYLFTSLLFLYYAQDSSKKKWQEILNNIGLTFQDGIVEISRHRFLFFLFFLFYFLFFVINLWGNWQQTV